MNKPDSERRQDIVSHRRNKYLLNQKRILATKPIIGAESGRALFTVVGKHLARDAAQHMYDSAESYVARSLVESDNKEAAKYIVAIGVEGLIPLVLVGWHTILGSVGTATDVVSSKLGGRIGDACMRELCLTKIEEEHPTEYRNFLKTEAGRKKMRHTWNFFERHFEGRYGIPLDRYKPPLAIKNIFGKIMLLTILRCTDLLEGEFQLRRRGTAVTKPLVIRPSDKMREYLNDLTEYAAESITHGYGYVVDKPEPWTSPTEGGYSEQGMYIVRGATMKTPMPSKEKCPDVYKALNILQAVPYVVDEVMYKLILDVFKTGKTLMGMQNPSTMYVQPMILGEDWDALTDDEKKLTGLTRRVHLAKWDSAISRRTQQGRLLNEARDILKSGGTCYFPSSCDFRGRIYQGHSFGPQGCDLSRAMLSFAVKEHVTDMRQFHLEGARRFGIKKSVEIQEEWVEEHLHLLLSLGEQVHAGTVLDSREFELLEVDYLSEPWQALQWCKDLYDTANGRAVGTICSVDATCHGLQIWSMLLRDKELGDKVNVGRAKGRADIYTEVARNVTKKLVERESPSAELLLDSNVTRALVKPMVMQVPYGLTILPVTETIHQHLLDTYELPNTRFFPAARNVSGIFFTECMDTLASAVKGMKWIKSVVSKHSKTGELTWDTPVGFPVHMKRVKYTSKKHDLRCLGFSSSVVTKYPTLAPNPGQIKRAVTANFVHGVDSSLVTLSVVGAQIPRLRVIHDSYGAHANDLAALHQTVLDTAQDLFSRNLLVEFAEQVNPAYTKSVPIVGTLDIQDISGSDYFLA